MIEKKDMKVGLLIWWSAERYMNEWSCPAIITAVGKTWFKVRTFDNFEETEQLRMDDIPNLDRSCRTSEMRICTLQEVQNYLRDRKRYLEDCVIKKSRESKDVQDKLKTYEEQIKIFETDYKTSKGEEQG